MKKYFNGNTISVSLVVLFVSFLLSNYIWMFNTFAQKSDTQRIEKKVDRLIDLFVAKAVK